MAARRLETLGRYASGAGGGFERPAEMLARVAQADARPMVGEHFVIEGGDEEQLLGETRIAPVEDEIRGSGSGIQFEYYGLPKGFSNDPEARKYGVD